MAKKARIDNYFRSTHRSSDIGDVHKDSGPPPIRKILGALSLNVQKKKQLFEQHLKPSQSEKQVITINDDDDDDDHKNTCDPKPSKQIDFNDPESYYQPPEGISGRNFSDFDRTQLHSTDICAHGEPHYAWDIFLAEKQREKYYKIKKYLKPGAPINAKMRAVLVDWMVQMQDGLALNHEVLYMAVKIVDRYLMTKLVSKDTLQLLGVVALLISSKYDERLPPEIEEFLDNTKRAYSKRQVIIFEVDILKALNFEISFPLSYRFLRRYARCIGCDMRTLTLARYILESSLLEYELIDELESKTSAAALLLAFKMLDFDGWTDAAEFYTQYKEVELISLMLKLNELISRPVDKWISFVRNKYANPVFMQVARIPPL